MMAGMILRRLRGSTVKRYAICRRWLERLRLLRDNCAASGGCKFGRTCLTPGCDTPSANHFTHLRIHSLINRNRTYPKIIPLPLMAALIFLQLHPIAVRFIAGHRSRFGVDTYSVYHRRGVACLMAITVDDNELPKSRGGN